MATEAAPTAFASELLLREVLVNAVTHPATACVQRRILCVLRLKPGRLLLAVHDGGKGFDWRTRVGVSTPPGDTRGRGLEILRQYANVVRFNSRGNTVSLIKRF